MSPKCRLLGSICRGTVCDENAMGTAGKSLLLGLAALGSLMVTSGCGSLSSNVVTYPKEHDRADMSRKAVPDIVEEIAGPFVENGTNVGLAIGVLDGDDKSIFGLGKTSLTSGEAPDGNTIFAIGSVTKAFLSLITHQLVQEGVLRLSDKLGDLLPSDVELSEPAKKITVGQLLTHSSGLPRQPNDLQMLVSLINYTFTGENIYRHIDADKVFELLRDFDPDPDEVGAYRYSNIGSGILGRVVELKTQKSLAVLLKERILDPIGARDTSYGVMSAQSSRVATGYVGDSPFFVSRNTALDQWDMGNILSGAAAMYSTANDLLEFARYRISLGKGNVETIPIRHGILSVSTKAAQKSSYGWMLDEFDDFDARIIFQYGIISGYSAYIGIEPDKKIGVVVLANNFNWDDCIGHNLLLTLAVRKALQRASSP